MITMTKAEFARRQHKTPTCVGQWIKLGRIGGEALVGAGRSVRIVVDIAERQLALRLDPGQALGNGARPAPRAPKADLPKPKPAEVIDAGLPAADDVGEAGSLDYQLQHARLVAAQADAQERKNAEAARDLVSVADAERMWCTIIAAARSSVLAVSGRLRRDLPHLTETQFKIIDAEIRAALEELGSGRYLVE